MTVFLFVLGLIIAIVTVAGVTRLFARRIDAAIDRSLPYPRWH
jgi:hypothetical protein